MTIDAEPDNAQRTEHTEEAATLPSPQADGDSTPPSFASAVALMPEQPDEEVVFALRKTDARALLLFSIAGFAVMTAGYRAAFESIDAIEGAFNHVYDESEIIKLVDGPMAAAVDAAFGPGMSEKQIPDLLRVFTE